VRRGQFVGFLAGTGGQIGAAILAVHGHPVAGGSLAVAMMAALFAAFLYRRRNGASACSLDDELAPTGIDGPARPANTS
jgi:hypothetical protein